MFVTLIICNQNYVNFIKAFRTYKVLFTFDHNFRYCWIMVVVNIFPSGCVWNLYFSTAVLENTMECHTSSWHTCLWLRRSQIRLLKWTVLW